MAAHEERRIPDGIKRRSVLRGGLLVGAGLATVGVASAALTGTAKAVSPQPNWAFCSLCNGLWYYGNSLVYGVCPSPTNEHLHNWAPSYKYQLSNNSNGGGKPAGYQGNWLWCRKCLGLFTTLHSPSACPAYGAHDGSGSFEYYLYVASSNSTNPQTNWRWCGNCQGLYFQGGGGGNSNGVCAGFPGWPKTIGNHIEGPPSFPVSDNYGIYWNGSY